MNRTRILAMFAALGAFLFGTSSEASTPAPAPLQPLPDPVPAPQPEFTLQDLIPAGWAPSTGYTSPDKAAANIAAAGMMVANAEGTARGPNGGYDVLFGWPAPGRTFDSASAVSDHPKRFFPYVDKAGRELRTSAAGKYQITATTYDDFRNRGKVQAGFTPAHQEAFFIAILDSDGALEDVKAGRLVPAINKMRNRWASLPGANVDQPMRSLAYVTAAYVAAGGTLA
ncbi:MAG: hypothetical protein V4706_14700 [Pseudomonadota bacterium]